MMRTITKMMLTAALLITGVGGAKARTNIDMSTATVGENATWNSVINTFSWTTENAYIVIPGLSGDLTGCYLDFTISAACHLDIVDTDDHVMNGGWNGYGRFGSGGSKTQDLGFMVSGSDCDITKVKEVRICSQSAIGSLTVENVSYYFPLKLEFDATGVATVPFRSIITSGGVTFDPATGVVTNTDGTGYLAIELPSSGIDLSTIKRIDVTYTGEDDLWGAASNRVLNDLDISGVNTWQGSRYSCDYTNYSASSANVSSIKWNAGGKTGGSLTITAIKFTSEFVSSAKAGETVLNTLPWNKTDGSGTEVPAWNMNGTSSSNSGTYYGNYSGDPSHYADLTDYSELRVYCTNSNTGFRCFFINADKSGVDQVYSSAAAWNETEKYYGLDLSNVTKWDNKVALKAIKSESEKEQNVTNIVVYKAPAEGSAQYLIIGKGELNAETTSLLANASVTSIDATGMTNVTKTTLTSANPNCLFFANANKLNNSSNVIVSDACAQLALSDGYPFKSPVAFTATAAPIYDRTFTTGAPTTVCLPFALTSDEAASLGKFYVLDSFNGNTLHFTSVSEPAANTPYLVVPTATDLTLSETGKSIAATPAELGASITNVDFIGTLAATQIPASDDENSYFAYNNGSMVKIVTKPATLPAFRGYFKIKNSGISSGSGSVRSLNISLDDESAGIKTIGSSQLMIDHRVYDLQGRRVSQPTKGLYIVNGKKVIK